MEDIKQKFLEWVVGNMEYGYLYEDVTDDGDGIFQLTGEGEDVVDFIEQELDKAREEGRQEALDEIHDYVVEEYSYSEVGDLIQYIEELSKLKQ